MFITHIELARFWVCGIIIILCNSYQEYYGCKQPKPRGEDKDCLQAIISTTAMGDNTLHLIGPFVSKVFSSIKQRLVY